MQWQKVTFLCIELHIHSQNYQQRRWKPAALSIYTELPKLSCFTYVINAVNFRICITLIINVLLYPMFNSKISFCHFTVPTFSTQMRKMYVKTVSCVQLD